MVGQPSSQPAGAPLNRLDSGQGSPHGNSCPGTAMEIVATGGYGNSVYGHRANQAELYFNPSQLEAMSFQILQSSKYNKISVRNAVNSDRNVRILKDRNEIQTNMRILKDRFHDLRLM